MFVIVGIGGWKAWDVFGYVDLPSLAAELRKELPAQQFTGSG